MRAFARPVAFLRNAGSGGGACRLPPALPHFTRPVRARRPPASQPPLGGVAL